MGNSRRRHPLFSACGLNCGLCPRFYNDGRRKSFFCLAVNLLAVRDVKTAMAELAGKTNPNAPIKEKAGQAVEVLRSLAEKRGVSLRLSKKRPEAP